MNPFSALISLALHHVSSLQSASIWYSDDMYNGRMSILYRVSNYYRFNNMRLQVLSWSNDVTQFYRSVLADPFSDLQGRAMIGQPGVGIMII